MTKGSHGSPKIFLILFFISNVYILKLYNIIYIYIYIYILSLENCLSFYLYVLFIYVFLLFKNKIKINLIDVR